jgi:hypothetical protein
MDHRCHRRQSRKAKRELKGSFAKTGPAGGRHCLQSFSKLEARLAGWGNNGSFVVEFDEFCEFGFELEASQAALAAGG